VAADAASFVILRGPNGSLGKQKSLQTDRVMLSPGPSAKVDLVNQISDWFINDGLIATRPSTRQVSNQ
jgi:hypothetical protein